VRVPTDSNSGSAVSAEPGSRAHVSASRTLIVVGVVVLVAVLVGGSLLTSRSAEPGRTTPRETSAAESKTGDPNSVAPAGSELKRITQPPSNAHVMISLPAGTPKLEVDAVFEPYGISPSGGAVIRVSDVTPVGDRDDAKELAQRLQGVNLVVRAGPGTDAASMRGGRYRGTIETVAEKEAFAFVLTKAELLP